MIDNKQLDKNRDAIEQAFNGKFIGAPAPKKSRASKAKAKAKALAAKAAETDAVAAAKAELIALAAQSGGGTGANGGAKRKPRKPKDAEAKGTGKGETSPCWFYNCGVHTPDVGTCSRTAKDCKFKHTKVSLAEFNKMERPTRNRSASRGAHSDGGQGSPNPKAKAKAKAKGKAKAKASAAAFWCRDYLKPSSCNRPDCPFPHLDSGAVEACKEANANKKKTSGS